MKIYQIRFYVDGKSECINFRDRVHAGNFIWRKMAKIAIKKAIPLFSAEDKLRDWVTRDLPGHFRVKTKAFVARIKEVEL
jgi:hypothetical protein